MTETIFDAQGSLTLLGRTGVGLILATAVAAIARQARALDSSGSVAAAACGTLCVAAGWRWAAVLIAYFVAATVLSRAGSDYKDSRTLGLVHKGGKRDAVQVLSNGGLYALAAAATLVFPSPWIICGAIGALAASSADTWATEIGVWLGGPPRMITNGTVVRPGTSGAVTGAGMLGSVSGSALVALFVMLFGFSGHVVVTAALTGGMGGSLFDSLLGATVQERRWCERCAEPTEQSIHRCGATTRQIGGTVGVDNDVVNLLSTFAGFFLGVIVYLIATGLGNGVVVG